MQYDEIHHAIHRTIRRFQCGEVLSVARAEWDAVTEYCGKVSAAEFQPDEDHFATDLTEAGSKLPREFRLWGIAPGESVGSFSSVPEPLILWELHPVPKSVIRTHLEQLVRLQPHPLQQWECPIEMPVVPWNRHDGKIVSARTWYPNGESPWSWCKDLRGRWQLDSKGRFATAEDRKQIFRDPTSEERLVVFIIDPSNLSIDKSLSTNWHLLYLCQSYTTNVDSLTPEGLAAFAPVGTVPRQRGANGAALGGGETKTFEGNAKDCATKLGVSDETVRTSMRDKKPIQDTNGQWWTITKPRTGRYVLTPEPKKPKPNQNTQNTHR